MSKEFAEEAAKGVDYEAMMPDYLKVSQVYNEQ